MKLQDASQKELRRMGIGMLLCAAVQMGVFLLLHLLGVHAFTYRVLLGTLCGAAVALFSFYLLCASVERAVDTKDEKLRKKRMQFSYNLRLALQAGWVVLAFAAPCFHVVAAALPLLYPTLIILFLTKKGTVSTPSTRPNPPSSAPEEEEEDRLETFES